MRLLPVFFILLSGLSIVAQSLHQTNHKPTDCKELLASTTILNNLCIDSKTLFCDTILLPIGIDSCSTCTGQIIDPGGTTTDYPNNADATFIIDPPGLMNITLTFLQFDLESSYDFLFVYDGPNTNSTLIGMYTGATIPSPITSSNGSLTIKLTSDGSVTKPGFVLSWAEIGAGQTPTAAYTVPLPTPHNWPILFNNQSTNAASFFWDFGDGTNSTNPFPTKTYSVAGAAYNTSLMVENCSATDTTYLAITIEPPSSIQIDPDTICVTLNQGDTTVVPVTVINAGTGLGIYETSLQSGGNTIIDYNKENYFIPAATTIHTYNNIPVYVDTLYLTLILNGDYDNTDEYAELVIDGTTLWQINDNNVPNGNNILVNYVLTGTQLTTFLADETLNIELVNSNTVDFAVGGDDTHEVIIQYNTLKWLDVNVLNNSTAANSQTIVDVKFDARNVAGGTTYTIDVPISTNDLNNPTETIHCKLIVNANPIAEFDVSDTLSCDGIFEFFDLSVNNPFSWVWDFGDGNTSTLQHPTHQYQNPGNYDVSLIVCNQTDCDTITKLALVNYDPNTASCLLYYSQYNSTLTLNGCTGTIFDHSGPNANYLDAAQDTIHIIPPGATSISLTFSVFRMENSFDFLKIYDGPDTNSPPLDSFTGVNLPPPITSTGGALTLVLSSDYSVSDEGFEAVWQCLIPAVPPIADFSHSYQDYCNGIVQFTDQSVNVNSWAWDFGDGNTSVLQNPLHNYALPGAYSVTLVAGNNAGTDTLQQIINADPFIASAAIPDTLFTGIPEIFDNTSPGAVFADWDFGDGNTSTDLDPLVSYASVGVYTVSLTTTHGNGCVDSLTHSVTVLPTTTNPDLKSGNTLIYLFPVPSAGPVELIVEHPNTANISVIAYNSLGQLIFKLSDQSNGYYRKALSFDYQPSGVYLLQIEVGDQIVNKKVVIQR